MFQHSLTNITYQTFYEKMQKTHFHYNTNFKKDSVYSMLPEDQWMCLNLNMAFTSRVDISSELNIQKWIWLVCRIY